MRVVPQLDLKQCGRSRQETGHTLATDDDHDEDDDDDDDEVIVMMLINDHNGSDGDVTGYHPKITCPVSLFIHMSL